MQAVQKELFSRHGEATEEAYILPCVDKGAKAVTQKKPFLAAC
jgi:hypothetical protein